MAITASAKSSAPRQLPPTGTHIARCYSVVDLGTHDSEWQGQKRRKHSIRISWELPNETADFGKGKPEPFSVHKNYALSLSDKATLRQDLENWRGRPFSDDELKAFDVASIIGVPCMVTVVHEVKPTATYANVTAVTSVPKIPGPNGKSVAMPVPDQFNPSLEYSIETHDDAAFANLPDFMKEQIQSSYEWKTRQTVLAGGGAASEPERPEQEWEAGPLQESIEDDNVPF